MGKVKSSMMMKQPMMPSPKKGSISDAMDMAFGKVPGKKKIVRRPGNMYGGMPGNSGPK